MFNKRMIIQNKQRPRPDRCVCWVDVGLHYPASIVTANTSFCISSKTAHFTLLECPCSFLVENCNYQAEEWADILTVQLISISLGRFYSLHLELAGQRIICTLWQVHHHPPVTLAWRDDAGFVLRQAHLGMFGSVLIDMIILNVSA